MTVYIMLKMDVKYYLKYFIW